MEKEIKCEKCQKETTHYNMGQRWFCEVCGAGCYEININGSLVVPKY